MYSPKLGRFMQRDPAGFVDGYNLYAYVSNNPLAYVDPSGLGQVNSVRSQQQTFNNYQPSSAEITNFNDANDNVRMLSDGRVQVIPESSFLGRNDTSRAMTVGKVLSNGSVQLNVFSTPRVVTAQDLGRISDSNNSDITTFTNAIQDVVQEQLGTRVDMTAGDYLNAVTDGVSYETAQGSVSVYFDTLTFGATNYVGITDTSRYDHDSSLNSTRMVAGFTRETIITVGSAGTASALVNGTRVARYTGHTINYGLKAKEGIETTQDVVVGVSAAAAGDLKTAAITLGSNFVGGGKGKGGKVEASNGLTPAGHGLNNNSSRVGYHATTPEVAELIKENGFRTGTKPGRLGSHRTYVNNTPEGAIAEFAHHNPGIQPQVLQVNYNPGVEAIADIPPQKYSQSIPINADTFTAPSVRAPGTLNSNVTNGSVEVIK